MSQGREYQLSKEHRVRVYDKSSDGGVSSGVLRYEVEQKALSMVRCSMCRRSSTVRAFQEVVSCSEFLVMKNAELPRRCTGFHPK